MWTTHDVELCFKLDWICLSDGMQLVRCQRASFVRGFSLYTAMMIRRKQVRESTVSKQVSAYTWWEKELLAPRRTNQHLIRLNLTHWLWGMVCVQPADIEAQLNVGSIDISKNGLSVRLCLFNTRFRQITRLGGNVFVCEHRYLFSHSVNCFVFSRCRQRPPPEATGDPTKGEGFIARWRTRAEMFSDKRNGWCFSFKHNQRGLKIQHGSLMQKVLAEQRWEKQEEQKMDTGC